MPGPMAMLHRFAAYVAPASLALGCSVPAPPFEPLHHATARIDDPASVRAAVPRATASRVEATDERLWLMMVQDDVPHGILYSIRFADGVLQQHLPHEEIEGLHRTGGGRLWSLSRHRESGDRRIWQRGEAGWEPIEQWSSGDAHVVTLTDSGERPIVLTTKQIFDLREPDVRVVALDVSLEPTFGFGPPVDGDTLHVGGDAGTLARFGVLSRIDLASGALRGVAYRDPPSGQPGSHQGIRSVVREPSTGCLVIATEDSQIYRRCEDHTTKLRGPWQNGMQRNRSLLFDVGRPFPDRSVETKRMAARMEDCRPRGYGCADLLPFRLGNLVPSPRGVWIFLAMGAVHLPVGADEPDALVSFPHAAWHRDAELRVAAYQDGGYLGTALPGGAIAPPPREARGPAPPATGCYRALEGEDTLCFTLHGAEVRAGAERRTVPVTFTPAAGGGLTAKLSDREALQVRPYGELVAISRTGGVWEYGELFERVVPAP